LIAALFVETNGCYFGLDGVDPWDVTRDAMRYAGPWPVVAHPPCERWGRFADGGMGRGTHEVGDDGECFASALASLRSFGGVLEHPAHSKAWDHFGLPIPPRAGWFPAGKDGWVCEVAQGHYGHPAAKLTWLYLVGPCPPELIWGKPEQRILPHIEAKYGYAYARRRGIVSNQSHKQRQRTPPEFRDLLLSLAQSAEIQATA